jgi:hypothetical protein
VIALLCSPILKRKLATLNVLLRLYESIIYVGWEKKCILVCALGEKVRGLFWRNVALNVQVFSVYSWSLLATNLQK